MLLNEKERSKLTLALLRNVLGAVQGSEVDSIVVVASDKKEVEENLSLYPKLKVIQESVPYGGVNGAVHDGFNSLRASNQKEKFLLIPSDLPLLDSEALDRVLSILDKHDLILNPSTKKNGTNLLGMRGHPWIPLHYDDDSFAKHLVEAEKSGLDYLTLDLKEFSFDIDDGEDLRMLMEIKHATSFDELFAKLSK